MSGVRFIRVHGRVVPVREKKTPDERLVKRQNTKIKDTGGKVAAATSIGSLFYMIHKATPKTLAFSLLAPPFVGAATKIGMRAFEAKHIQEARARLDKKGSKIGKSGTASAGKLVKDAAVDGAVVVGLTGALALTAASASFGFKPTMRAAKSIAKKEFGFAAKAVGNVTGKAGKGVASLARKARIGIYGRHLKVVK